MSWSKLLTIWCDARVVDETGEHQCGQWENADGGVREGRQGLRRCGWAHRDGEDRCPAHPFEPKEGER